MNDQNRDNFCYLLGLNPFREDRYEQADIVKAIDSRKSKWESATKANRGGSKAVYTAYVCLDLVPEMRRVMDNKVLRHNEFEDARKILRAKASRLIRSSVVFRNGAISICPSAIRNLMKAVAWENVEEDTLIEASGISNTPLPRVVDAQVINCFEALNDIGLWHPYDFVNRIISIPSLAVEANTLDEFSSYDDFRGSFKTVYNRLSSVSPGKVRNQDAYINVGRSLNLVQTDEQIGSLIAYCRCRLSLKPVLTMMDDDSGQPFDHGYIDNIIDTFVSGRDLDEDLAVYILEDYCLRKGYPANFSGKDSGLAVCPSCTAMIPSSDSLFFCPVCGSPVRTMCPVCGKIQAAGNRNCSGCGSNLSESRTEAEKMDSRVRSYISVGEVESAKNQLSDLKAKYPRYGQNEELSDLVSSTDGRLACIRSRVSEDSIARNLYDLKTCVEESLSDFPDLLSDGEIRNRYDEACSKVSEADALCVQAASKSGEEATELYIRASAICPDHPDAVSQLKGRPPEGPADASAEARSDCVILRYAVPEERRGMTFCIYRGSGAYPEVDQSTVPLAETDRGAFSDNTPDPGIAYFYRIYSKRWGVLSREYAECGPAMVVREVTNVTITPVEDGFVIRYLVPSGCTRVRVWRKEGGTPAGEGEETEIADTGSGVFEDHGLRGGQVYSYLFVAEYEYDGDVERSLGTVFNCETPLYPDPVDDMVIRWNKEDGTYTARWSRTERVDLYCSQKRPQMFGRTASLEDLGRWMSKIVPLETFAGGCTFALEPGSAVYVYPVIPVGETGVRGTESLVANLRPFRDVEKKLDGGDCLLTATWPDGAGEAVILINGADDDPSAEKVTVTREEYEQKGYVRVPMKGASRRTISMFAVYDVEGERMRSIGISTDVWSGTYRKVAYSLRSDPVKGENGRMRVHVRIECQGAVSVPRCVMVLVPEGIPLKMNDGEIVWESEDPMVLKDGRYEGDFVLEKDRSALDRMRLFFPRKEDYSRFRFVHPLRRL